MLWSDLVVSLSNKKWPAWQDVSKKGLRCLRPLSRNQPQVEEMLPSATGTSRRCRCIIKQAVLVVLDTSSDNVKAPMKVVVRCMNLTSFVFKRFLTKYLGALINA